MEGFLSFVESTTEYQGWGLNAIAAGFVLTAVLTFCLQFPGLVSQARTIWKNRSAEGVETLTFIVFLTYFLVFLPYAFSIRSGAGVLNAIVLLPPQLVIVAGVARFKNFRFIDILAAIAGLALIIAAFVLPHKEIFFTITSVATFGGLLLQPIEMLRTKTSVNVALSFPLTFAFVTLVWAVYGIAISDLFLSGASAAFMCVYVWTATLWFRYHRKVMDSANY